MSQTDTRPGRPDVAVAAPLITVALAIALFAVDTFSSLGAVSAVFYSLVVMVAGAFLPSQRVVIVAVGCGVLALASFLIRQEFGDQEMFDAFAGLSAIALATVLTVRNLDTAEVLRDQASLLNVSHDAIFVCDMEGAATYWNAGAELLYGWRRAEAAGQKVSQLLRSVFPVPEPTVIQAVMDTGGWEGELTHVTRDGTNVVVASRWSLKRNRTGLATAILRTESDITARRFAEQQLRDSRDNLARSVRLTALSELTASIAHEVNQPLAAVVTNGEVALRLLARDSADLPEIRDIVGDMVGGAGRASDVVRGLRSLYQRTTLAATVFSINDLIEETLAILRQDMVARGVSLRIDLVHDLPQVAADRSQVQQVLINLFSNGLDAMDGSPAGTRVLTVRTHQDAVDRVTVAVADTGTGIPDGWSERIFEPFMTTKPQGMGMGLSICQAIVVRHGGKLWAAPNAGGPGSTFSFWLPTNATDSQG